MAIQTEIRAITAKETLPLRREMLRPNRPLQDSIYLGDDDSATQHWGAFFEGALIAVASLYPEPLPNEPGNDVQVSDSGQADSIEHIWRLRGMAVHLEFQGRGCGRELLNQCLQSVAACGGNVLWCNARASAVDFYNGVGFRITGHEFEIPDVGPHFVMLRNLNNSA